MSKGQKITMAAVQVFRCMCGGGHPCPSCRKHVGSMCDATKAFSHCPHCAAPLHDREPVRLDRWRPDNRNGRVDNRGGK